MFLHCRQDGYIRDFHNNLKVCGDEGLQLPGQTDPRGGDFNPNS